MTRADQRKRYKLKHPEKVKASKARYLERVFLKKVEAEGTAVFDRLEKKLLQQFETLTRLRFKHLLPQVCADCGRTEDLNIHHIRYVFPLNQSDLKVLCRGCHVEEHNRLRK